uniref:Uncharacterized protein n=1 Tax=Petromyzon marinus TaxID=7757 RepID=S4RPD2_PETMA
STMTDKFTESEKVKTVLKVELDAKRKEAADLSNKLSEAKNSKSSLASELEAKKSQAEVSRAELTDSVPLQKHKELTASLQGEIHDINQQLGETEHKYMEADKVRAALQKNVK